MLQIKYFPHKDAFICRIAPFENTVWNGENILLSTLIIFGYTFTIFFLHKCFILSIAGSIDIEIIKKTKNVSKMAQVFSKSARAMAQNFFSAKAGPAN